ncbi:hypothetical protein HY992_04070 [Candidatus Micrarchaeota archaeon]|nr:hypothetical protein [Candidatus Micrarchaeota archaeon]
MAKKPAAAKAEVAAAPVVAEVAQVEIARFARSPEVLQKLIDMSKEYAEINRDLPERVLKHVLPIVLEKSEGDLAKLDAWHKALKSLLSYYEDRVGANYVCNFTLDHTFDGDSHRIGALPELVRACESPSDLAYSRSFIQFFESTWMHHDDRLRTGAVDGLLREVVPRIFAKAKTPEARDEWCTAVFEILGQYKPYLVPSFAGNVLPAMLDKCETPADLKKWNAEVHFVVGIDSTSHGHKFDVDLVVSRGLPALIEACADLKEFERVTGNAGVKGFANELGDPTAYMLLIAQHLKSA